MLARYEKRSNKAATQISVSLGLVICAAALIMTLTLVPMTVWTSDRPWAISATVMSNIWSLLFTDALKYFNRSDSTISILSAHFFAGLVASAELLWRDDIMMCL